MSGHANGNKPTSVSRVDHTEVARRILMETDYNDATPLGLALLAIAHLLLAALDTNAWGSHPREDPG